MAVIALGFVGCTEESVFVSPDGTLQGDMPVNITFSFADKARTRSMVSGTEKAVHIMQMVCFDANGLYLGIRNAEVKSDDPGTNPPMYDTGVIKGSVPQGTARIHFIANRNLTIPLSHNVGTAEETVMQSVELSTAYNDKTVGEGQEICYWGYHKAASADDMNAWLNPKESGSSVVYMIRDRAKVVLTYDPTGAEGDKIPVKKVEWLIHNGRDRGYLAPKSADWESYYARSSKTGELVSTAGINEINEYENSRRYSLWRSETDNEDENFDVAYENGANTGTPQFLFEDGNEDIDDLKAVLKVTYTVGGADKTVYHVLRLKKNDTTNQVGERYPIVRNNTYYITCKLLSPNVAYYETLKDAINGTEYMNAEVEIDRSITDVNNDTYTLQILLPTETTSIVLDTEGPHQLDFAFRKASDVTQEGSTDPADFEVKWEKAQTFCSDPVLTYVPDTKQFQITTNVIEGKLTDKLQDEWIVVKHKASGLTRYIHVFVINQFQFEIHPTLKKDGDNYVLHFRLPPMVHKDSIPDPANPGKMIPDPAQKIHPESLYPIDVKFTTNTLNAYNITKEGTNYGLFGVSVESTSELTDSANFETGYKSPVSSIDWGDRTHWYFQQENNYWDFWYTYSLKTYPEGGNVNIYFKDVRDNIKYAKVGDVGLFLYVKYFGKNYSVPGPVTTN